MIGFILSLLTAVILFFNPLDYTLPDAKILAALFCVVAFGLFVLYNLTLAFALTPLQKTEQNSTPRLFSLLKKDKHMMGVYAWSVLFLMVSLYLAFDAVWLNHFKKNYLIMIWVIGLGLSLDVYHSLLKRLFAYLSPFENASLFTQLAEDSIRNDNEIGLCEAVDSLTEISTKAISKNGTSLANQGLQELQLILKKFLESSKSISHVEADLESKKIGIKDRISFTLFYILDRVASITEAALSHNLDSVISTANTVLGKMAIHCAKCDLSLVSSPVHFLTKNAKNAMDKGFQDIGVKSSITLLEVSKTIINEVDYTYGDLKDPFFSITNGLEEIIKEIYLHDKDINLKVLTQPFRELRELFKNPKVAEHQDTPVIISNIDRVLGEYASLELVMRTIPPIPEVPEENV